MSQGSGANSELAALLASRRRKTAADDHDHGTSGATELGQTMTTIRTNVAAPETVSSTALEANLHKTQNMPVPVAEEADGVFAEARRKLRPVAGSMPGMPSVSAVAATAAAAAAAAAVITPDQTPNAKRASPMPDDNRGWNEDSSCSALHYNATSHDNVDIVAGDLVDDDNIEIKSSAAQSNPTQPSPSTLKELAIGDDAAATSNHGAAGHNASTIAPASVGEREGDRTAPTCTHTTSRRDSASSSPSSGRPQTPGCANKMSPSRDVSSSASRRLRASPRYRRYVAKNRADAAAAKHDAEAPVTTKPTDNISTSSSEEEEESSQTNDTFTKADDRALMMSPPREADDRALMSPPRDSARPFSRLEELGFDAGRPPNTHSAQVNADTCENNLPFSRQASPVIAENPVHDYSSPGDDTDVVGENTHSLQQGNADLPFSRRVSPAIAENPIQDTTSLAGDDADVVKGNELDGIMARACGSPPLHVADTESTASTTEEPHNYSHLQRDDDGSYSSDMVSISDATVKQGNTIDDQAGGGGNHVLQTTPKRRTSKGSAFIPSPRRSSPPRVPRRGEVSPTARLVRLEVENGKLRNEVSRLIMEVGIKDAIIADLKQRLNDLKPREGNRVEAKSLKRVLQKEKDFVPLNILHEPPDQKFLC